MTELKCPFCQQELQETFGIIKQFWCSNYYNHTHPINLQGTKELWQELIRTKQQLEIALDALNTIKGKHDPRCAVYHIDEKTAYDALEQITALEQKDK